MPGNQPCYRDSRMMEETRPSTGLLASTSNQKSISRLQTTKETEDAASQQRVFFFLQYNLNAYEYNNVQKQSYHHLWELLGCLQFFLPVCNFPVTLHSFRQHLQGETAKLINGEVVKFHGYFNSLNEANISIPVISTPKPPSNPPNPPSPTPAPFPRVPRQPFSIQAQDVGMPKITSAPHDKVQL